MADVCAQGRHDSQARTDRRIVNEGGIVVADPLVHVGMIRVARIGHGIEQLVEAGNASAIFRWCIPFSADVTRIGGIGCADSAVRSEEHTSELQSLMRISYSVFCLK